MNRNIIKPADAALVAQRESEKWVSREQIPPGETVLPKPPEPDGWYQRLLKYIPGEAVGLYLFLDNLCKTEFPLPAPAAYATKEELIEATAVVNDDRRIWLAGALVVALVFNWVYLWRLWEVRRVSQLVISCLALVVYVCAIGGVFATCSWYRPTLGMAALAIGAAFLTFVKPPGKPIDPDQGQGGKQSG